MEDLTGLLAVLFIFGTPFLCTICYFVYKAFERRQTLAADRQQSYDRALEARVSAVQAEVSQLRDTSTQFDVSLQQSLDRIERRLDHLERHSFGAAEATTATPPKRTLGR